jgi:hypothetical protein
MLDRLRAAGNAFVALHPGSRTAVSGAQRDEAEHAAKDSVGAS